MPTSPPHPTAFFTAPVRGTLVAATAAIAMACAQTDATGPRPEGSSRTLSVNGQGPQACAPDNKLLGRFAASTADAPGTWWRLSKDRFDALGVTDYKAALEGFYGKTFATLDEAIQYLIAGVAAYDANGNGYVCAYEERGTRAYLGVNALFLLGIADDKHVDD